MVIEDWEYYGPPTGDILSSSRGYIGGFKRMCEELGGVELVGILSPRDARGGSSGSWITKEAFDKYSSLIADDLKKSALDALEISPGMTFEEAIKTYPYDYPITCSSDAHYPDDIGKGYTSFLLEEGSLAEIKKALKNEDGRKLIHLNNPGELSF